MNSKKDGAAERPEWIPEGADGALFATEVMRGIESSHDGLPGAAACSSTVKRRLPPKRRLFSVEEYRDGILSGDKTMLARAITLIESNAPAHFDLAQCLMAEILPHSGKSFRVGITGVPGAGKSTFIECLGTMLCRAGKKVAVLAVDPSSTVTGGSILGDKTRMENLSRCENAFIRPSPSGGTLGGVARKSRETMLLCEAAGYDTILIETVGVGQSEVTVRSMSDFFLLVQLATQGDDLQGIKKGVIELADAIVVNKCDGGLVEKSTLKKAELAGVLHFLNSPTPGWRPFCEVCSASTGFNVMEVWKRLEGFREKMLESGFFETRRARQKREWMHSVINDEILREFYSLPEIAAILPRIEEDVENSAMPVTAAVKALLDARRR